MARPFTFADREQAAAAKELDAKIDAARERHARAVTVLHESIEALKKARAAMRKSARDLIAAEKKAKGDVKALVQVKDETERGIVGALKAGRVPSDSDFVVERT